MIGWCNSLVGPFPPPAIFDLNAKLFAKRGQWSRILYFPRLECAVCLTLSPLVELRITNRILGMILIYHSTGKMMSRFHRTELPSFFFCFIIIFCSSDENLLGDSGIRSRGGEFPEFRWNWIWRQWDRAPPRQPARNSNQIDIGSLISLSLSLRFSPFPSISSSSALARNIKKWKKKIKLKGKKKERKAIFIWRIFTICVESRIVYHLLEGNDSGDGWHHHMRRSKSNWCM